MVDAAATKPFGFQASYPGPGVGGHCIPLDPQFLAWRAREANFATRFIDPPLEFFEGLPSRRRFLHCIELECEFVEARATDALSRKRIDPVRKGFDAGRKGLDASRLDR